MLVFSHTLLQVLWLNHLNKRNPLWSCTTVRKRRQRDQLSLNLKDLDLVNWQVYRLWVQLVAHRLLNQSQLFTLLLVLREHFVMLTSEVVSVLIKEYPFSFVLVLPAGRDT